MHATISKEKVAHRVGAPGARRARIGAGQPHSTTQNAKKQTFAPTPSMALTLAEQLAEQLADDAPAKLIQQHAAICAKILSRLTLGDRRQAAALLLERFGQVDDIRGAHVLRLIEHECKLIKDGQR